VLGGSESEPEFVNVEGAQESFPPAFVACAGIFKQSMGARSRNRVRKGLSYWAARLHSPAELVPCNRFLGSLNV
jgi:hypothetical protein